MTTMSRQGAFAAVLTAVLMGCGGSSGTDGGTGGGGGSGGGAAGGSAGGAAGDIVSVAQGNPEFSILVQAVTKAGLVADLQAATPKKTVFAPTNAAFTALLTELGATSLDDLTAEQLKPILLYHVLGTEVRAAAATTAAMGNAKVDALGGKIQLSLSGQSIQLDARATVVTADVSASNGVVHAIDKVLLPSITDIATTTPAVSSLVAALTLADTGSPSPGLVAALDNDAAAKVTVFAPTDAAFTALVTALKGNDNGAATGITALTSFTPALVLPVLAYHVATARYLASQVPTAATAIDTLGGKVTVQRTGAAVTVDGVNVATANLLASNGVIHIIGSVLVPSITDVVTTSSKLSSLKTAVLAADGASGTAPKIATVLDGAGPFTLFAPSNAAFTALGTAPTGQALTNVLAYHAVPGAPVYAAAALGLTAPLIATTALTGKTLTVTAEGMPKQVKLADSTANKATVTEVNYFTSNGVIHVVDKVLIPAP